MLPVNPRNFIRWNPSSPQVLLPAIDQKTEWPEGAIPFLMDMKITQPRADKSHLAQRVQDIGHQIIAAECGHNIKSMHIGSQ